MTNHKIILTIAICVLFACTKSALRYKECIDSKPLIDLLGYGIFSSRQIGEIPANTICKNFGVLDPDKYQLMKQTDTVPCKLGIMFGVKFNIYQIPSTEKVVKMKSEWKFPKLTREDGYSDTTSINDWQYEQENGKVENKGFSWNFEDEYELVPGKWQLNVYLDGKLVISKTFIVVQVNENEM